MTPVLSVRNLKVHFPLSGGLFGGPPQAVKAVDDVSFDLAPGEVLAIVGESGCGKSTLGRAVLRLIPPTAGTIAWSGADVTGLPENDLRPRRRDMQIIFQDPLASLDPRMTVAQIIGRPLRTFHPEMKRAEINARVNETMRQVGLSPSLAHRYPPECSGGQCQRIGNARAIILRPKRIVCDEPVSALDVSIQAQIINLLMRLRRELGMALIFISHNMSVVRHISDRVMVLYLGREAEIAGRDAFFARPLHPYAQALLSAVPIPDPARAHQRRRMVLQGDTPSPINPPSGCAFRTRCPHAVDLCAQAMPVLRDFDPGHRAACHRIEDLAGALV